MKKESTMDSIQSRDFLKKKDKKAAEELVKIAKLLTGYGEEIIIETAKIRVYRTDREGFTVQEMPSKGKKRLRRLSLSISEWAKAGGTDYSVFSTVNLPNLEREAGLSRSMSYDQAKKALEGSMDEMHQNTEDKAGESINIHAMFNGPYEDQVYYLEVEPSDARPFTAKGKDFTVSVEWTEFKAYSPDSDFQQSDPHYTLYESKSATAARKFYKILKADETALRSVSWSDFSDWLRSKKVNYDTHFSVWR